MLQHVGTCHVKSREGSQMLSVLSLVPDSGTGALAGITGKFEIIIADGTHSYEFNYMLP